MRKLPIIATTLLCSSLAFAQVEDETVQDESVASTEAVAEETAPAEEAAPAEEVATEEAAPVEEVAAEEAAPAEEVAPSEEVAAAEEAAPAEAPKKDLTSTAPVKGPAPVVGASAKLAPEAQMAAVEENSEGLVENMESTLMGKDDLPLAVSGYMAFRLKNFHYSEPSPYVRNDLARTNVDAVLNVNVVAMPNSYMTLWTNLSIPFDLSGSTDVENLAGWNVSVDGKKSAGYRVGYAAGKLSVYPPGALLIVR